MITFEQALALKQADYITVEQAGIKPEEMVSACVDCMVITNRTSKRPMACTREPLDGCISFLIENTANGTLAVNHIPHYRKQALAEMIRMVRRNRNEKLRLHMVGTLHGSWGGQPLRSYDDWRNEMEELLQVVNQAGNIELCTFDTGHKPHPISVGIAYVNGKARLIRATPDVISYDQVFEVAEASDYYTTHPFAGALQFDPAKELTPPFMPSEAQPQYLAWDGRELENQNMVLVSNSNMPNTSERTASRTGRRPY